VSMTLDQPASNFDLFVYTGNADGADCLMSPEQAFGSPLQFTAEWDDKQPPPTGFNDTRVFAIEVRHTGAELCADTGEWTLTVKGN